MNTVQAITTIRDSLRNHLTDPYSLAGGVPRTASTYIFADEPILGAKYPQIQLKKLDNPTVPISIGPDYWEHEQVFINIWFYSKNGFKLTVNGVEYTNAQLVEYYLSLIKTTLKSQFLTLQTAGVGGYKHINTSPIGYDPETQLYYGNVNIRVWWFNST